MTAKQREAQEYLDKLRAILKPGDTVYTILRHRSRSGMQRVIGAVIKTDGELRDWSGYVAAAVERRWDNDRGGVVVGGCGMDMGFELVYNLSAVLWPEGFQCIGAGGDGKPRCPSNDHSNGDRDYSPHAHKSGGY